MMTATATTPVTVTGFMREVIADNPSLNDPREIADMTAKLTDPAVLMDFYTQALVQMAREVLGNGRRAAMGSSASAGKTTLAERIASGEVICKPRRTKADDCRDWWAAVLDARVHIGGSEWKKIGDCGIDDLQFCIDERLTLISRTEDQIVNYQFLQKLLVKHGRRTVADLPPQTSWNTQ